jgi:hypothetical protein
MQITTRQLVFQHAHILQQGLFPHLATVIGPLSPHMELLAGVCALVPLHKLIGRRCHMGRPAKDRLALATAFIAKAIFNLPTTRDLIDRLRVDHALREYCGWTSSTAMPHESKFSRAFAEFAAAQLPQQLHAIFVKNTQGPRLIGHIARDSTAIPAREAIADRPARFHKKKRKPKANKKRASKRKRNGSFQRAKAHERGSRLQRQPHQTLEAMLADLPRHCDVGVKKDHHGNLRYWTGYKLHLDVADGQIPISAVLTSAKVHDSQVAIPLMTLTSKRVTYLYDLMDSAYDADAIHEHCRRLEHVPIIAVHPRRGTKKPSPLTRIFAPKPTPQLTWAQQDRFKERTMIERVNARLKDEFGASHVRVRGAAKVMAHLMFGVLALTADQWLKLSG